MNEAEFEALVSKNPALSGPIKRAARAGAEPANRMAFGLDPGDLGLIAMFPIVLFLIKEVGLPWAYEATRYSEVWRQKFHDWIDQQSKKQGQDPDALAARTEALRKELERIKALDVQKAWETLAEALKAIKG
jgi:hypothetical protein